MASNRPTIGLALGGGGIRGFCHVGVIEVMEKNKIAADVVAGTSIGSVMAAMYACGCPSTQMLDYLLNIEKTFQQMRLFNRPDLKILSFSKDRIDGFVDGDIIEAEAEKLFGKLGVKNIKDIKMPLVIPSVDINTGKLILFTNDATKLASGTDSMAVDDVPISLALRASMSFPGVISSRKYGDMRLVDGGVRMNIPSWPLREIGAQKVIAVTMSAPTKQKRTFGMIDVVTRSIDILSTQLSEVMAHSADLHMDIEFDGVTVFGMGSGKTAYEKGVEEAQRHLDALKELMPQKKTMFTLFKNWSRVG